MKLKLYLHPLKNHIIIINTINILLNMSELSELLKTAKNIEKQNSEIIRLLKKIANEDEDDKLSKYRDLLNYTPDFGDLHLTDEKTADDESEEEIENTFQIGDLLENSIEVGEVYFIEEGDIFKLSVKNNESVIDNLTGTGQPSMPELQELIANESIEKNASLDDGTVILSLEQSQNLPETIKICVEQGAKTVHMPFSVSTQLIAAPQVLMKLINLSFYRNEEDLIEKLFG